MAAEPGSDQTVTQMLQAARGGDAGARERLFQAVYAELCQIARCHMSRERENHTLEPSALVNEAMLRLLGQDVLSFDDRRHFLRTASRVMRRVLVDHARARNAEKRDGGLRVTLHDVADERAESAVDVLALDRALTRLAEAEPRWAQVVELRFLLGLEVAEVAEALGISTPTVKRDWRFARAWLARELSESAPGIGDDE
jgi:RNA polymerase sigma factor (TIGR02999 family)